MMHFTGDVRFLVGSLARGLLYTIGGVARITERGLAVAIFCPALGTEG
jgi:hypothetical protein